MGKKDKFRELVFQLGDLARDRLGHKPERPKAMEHVFVAEDELLASREEVARHEEQMNDVDLRHKEYLERAKAELLQQEAVVEKFKKAVDAAEGRVKGLRKQLTTVRAEVRFGHDAVKKSQARLMAQEGEGVDPKKLEPSRESLKKQKLALMRKEREVEELEAQLRLALTPSDDQPGGAGILAHRRVLELEDELEERKLDFEEKMADLDAAIVQCEEEVKAAEDSLDEALFKLGEECYALKIKDTELAAFYPKLDSLK